MKKIIAIAMLVALILSAVVCAHAEEVCAKAWRIALNGAGKYEYFVTYVTSAGTSQEFKVPESEFNLAVEEIAKVKNEEMRKAEKEAKKAESNKGGLFGTGLFAKKGK